MLNWLGHEAVAVLDGGPQAWQAAGGPVRSGPEPAPALAPFTPGPALRRLLSAAEVLAALGPTTQTLLDARATPRYRGEVEPLDPVAGHIPGALNRPFTLNFQDDGRFKPAAQLRA
jgi:thiosulfate/3-mercaptopyruvate sulfurtransferase